MDEGCVFNQLTGINIHLFAFSTKKHAENFKKKSSKKYFKRNFYGKCDTLFLTHL